jgi:capsular exopolysaccharide synthesis family protein
MTDETTEPINQPEQAERLRTRLLRVKSLLFTWWWIPALAMTAGVCLRAWLVLAEPIEYQSYGRIIASGRIAIPEGTMFNEEAANFFGTQIELIQSADVRARAADAVKRLHPELTPSPVELNAFNQPRTSLFVLTAKGPEPLYLRAFLDAVMNEYIALRRGMVSEKSENTLSAISRQLVELEKELRDGEDAVLEWQKANNLVFLKEEGNSAGNYLAALNRRLAVLETEYQLLKALSLDQNLDRIDYSVPVNDPDVPADQRRPGEVVSVGPAVEYLQARQQLFLLQAEKEQMLQVFKPGHRKMVDLQSRIALQEKRIEILRRQSEEQLLLRSDALRVQIENTRAQIAEWEVKALDLSRRLGEFDRLNSKVQRQKLLYDRLIASVQSVDVGANIQQDVVSVLEPASSAVQIQPPLARDMTMGGLAGLALGAGILFVIGMLDDRIVSISELQTVFAQEVVGVIPRANLAQMPLLKDNDDRLALVEAFRNLRSWIFFTPWEGTPPKTFLITSSIPEEGKTALAANLAISLASSGAKTLLVDGDLRRGRLHSDFGVEAHPGFGDVLGGEVPPSRAIVPTAFANLSILAKGHFLSPRNEVFFGASFDHFLAEVSRDFDHVLFDSCPMLAVDDTSSLAPKVDVVFFVIRCNFTSIRLARKALAVLRARHANVQGIIYNAVDRSAADYPYYRYGYDYGTKKTAGA